MTRTQPASDGAAYEQLARYYDQCDLDRTAEIAFYGSLVPARASSVLELACGTGTIIAGLVKFGPRGAIARAMGLDAADGMLAIARDRHPGVEWAKGDMRDPPVDGPFDLVICCYNGLQLMMNDDDLALLFASARRLTAPGGLFAFDLYQPNFAYLTGPHPDRIVRRFVDDDGLSIEVHESGAYDPATRILTTDWRFLEGGGREALSSRFWLRQYTAEDIEGAAKAAGFEVRDRFGDFHRAPFTPESRRQVVVCTPSLSSD